MFKYTYLLERRRETQDQSVVSERLAHNILVHQWVELGFLGFLTTLGLFAAPVAISGYLLIFRRRDELPFSRLVVLGFVGVLVGRFVEQMVGVAAISDLTLFFVLLGLFAALPTVARGPQTPPQLRQVSVEGRRRRVSSPKARVLNIGTQTIFLIAISLSLIAGIGVLTWTKSINYLTAGFQARDGLDSLSDGELRMSLDSLNRAIDLAPDVFVYNNLRAAVYSIYRRQYGLEQEPECASLANPMPYRACLARQEYLSNLQAAEQRSLDWRPRLSLAQSTLTLALTEGNPKIANEATRHYLEVAQLDPKTWWHWEWLAAAHIQIEQPNAALEPLEQSLRLLDGTPRSASSRLLQGMAYLGMDDPRSALRSLNDAIRLNPKLSDAYTNRGAAYNVLGRYERGLQDLDEAIKLNPYSTTAYNNRGNSYGNLDRFERAIEDYDEAIRLDPQSTLTYANRALALTYQGMDDEAQKDIARAKELGLDPTSILAIMDDVKNSR
jgi:tetratricopeptide (TPR) repeat protein